MLCLDCFFFFCIYWDFWFLVTMRFSNSSLYITKTAVSWKCICALLFLELLILTYLCVDDFLPSLITLSFFIFVCLSLIVSFSFVIFQFLLMAFSLLPREIPLAFAAKLVMVVLISLSFCLSVKLLISLSNLNESLAGRNSLSCKFFLFITWNILCHSLLACRVSAEKSADSLIEIPLYVMLLVVASPCCF